MFDPDTLVITYDPERGEPRGARKKGSDPAAWAIASIVACALSFVRRVSIFARAAVRMHRLWCLYRCLRSGYGQGWQAARPDSLHH
jgi:hypothetical protein